MSAGLASFGSMRFNSRWAASKYSSYRVRSGGSSSGLRRDSSISSYWNACRSGLPPTISDSPAEKSAVLPVPDSMALVWRLVCTV